MNAPTKTPGRTRNAIDQQEVKMTATELDTDIPVLYWVTLAIMFTAFAAVVLS